MKRFQVEYRVEGRVVDYIDAETFEEAKAKAEKRAYDEDAEFELIGEEIEDVRVDVWKMTKVRDKEGKVYWTSYVWSGYEVLGDDVDET